MVIPISSHLINIIQEALAIAYQVVDDQETADAFKEVMWQLEQATLNTVDQSQSEKLVPGEKGNWKLH